MAEDPEGPLVVDPNQPNAPPYRPWREMPYALWIQSVADRIEQTGQPELIVGLYWGKIDRKAKFYKLRLITIDTEKRPNADMAPCPRCGCDSKFIHGVLAWFYELQFCAVIGHCCADQKAQAEADREYRARKRFWNEETYLLEGLPKLAAKANVLEQMREPATEALMLYRQFHNQCPIVHQHLRELKAKRGGELKLLQIIRSAEDEEESDYVGPAGFRGRGAGETETRDIHFGYIAGKTAVTLHFDPVKQIDTVLRTLYSFGLPPNEEEALELIVKMDESRRRAAVAILQGVDKGYAKLAAKLTDFWTFFTRVNVERLNAYGEHPENHFPFSMTYQAGGGRALVTITHRRMRYRLSFADKHAAFAVDWPA